MSSKAKKSTSTRKQASSQKSGTTKSSPRTRKTSSSETSTPTKQATPSQTPSTDPSSTSQFTELEPLPYKTPVRDPNTGQFLPGKSGNPSGRPPSTKNQITAAKQDLELAIRQNIAPDQIAQIVHRMYELALMGSVGAAKLLLDKTISNAKSEEDEDKGAGGVTIKIENLTMDNVSKGEMIDVTPSKLQENE